MQCPNCVYFRSSGSWRPSQWRTWSPVTEEFHQCKVCDGELAEQDSWAWSQPIEPSSPPPPPSSPPPSYNWPPEGAILLDIAKTMKQDTFAEFIDLWMENLSRRTRKNLSHSGALRSNDGDPVHFICKHTGLGYFDPTNYIYFMTLMFLAGPMSRSWNTETRGDICEALMGFSYELTHNERVDVLDVGQHVHKVARIIEVTATLTYKLWINTGIAFKDWCARIMQMRNVQEYNAQFNLYNAPRPKKNFIMVPE